MTEISTTDLDAVERLLDEHPNIFTSRTRGAIEAPIARARDAKQWVDEHMRRPSLDASHYEVRGIAPPQVGTAIKRVAVETRPGDAVILRCTARGCARPRVVGSSRCWHHGGPLISEEP